MIGGALLRGVLGRPGGAFGLVVVAAIVVVAVAAPLLAPYDPNAIAPAIRLQPPTLHHILGTDHLGRDLFSRVLFGARIAIGVSIAVTALALVIGVALGIAAALAPKSVDQALLGLFDIVTAFPSVILALALVAVFGPGLGNIVLLVAIVFIPHFGRVARAQTLALRNATFFEAETVLGTPGWRILLFHIVPNIIGPIAVLASMDIPVVITVEAGLSFLGLGVRPPLASWGGLLSDGYTYLDQSMWPAIASGTALILATLGFSLFGESLRDTLDPKLAASR
jgi:peptide/nickel transport system permease protein